MWNFPGLRIEPVSLALARQILNHRTTKGVRVFLLKKKGSLSELLISQSPSDFSGSRDSSSLPPCFLVTIPSPQSNSLYTVLLCIRAQGGEEPGTDLKHCHRSRFHLLAAYYTESPKKWHLLLHSACDVCLLNQKKIQETTFSRLRDMFQLH